MTLALKGKAEPVPAWTAPRITARTRGERPRLGLEAQLVGRDEELAVLKQTLRRVETEGRPALVTIVGPAGVGKSRLVAELEHYAEGLPQIVYWRRGRYLAYGNTSYSPFADAIKAQCEILRGRRRGGCGQEGRRGGARAVRRGERRAADLRARRGRRRATRR